MTAFEDWASAFAAFVMDEESDLPMILAIEELHGVTFE